VSRAATPGTVGGAMGEFAYTLPADGTVRISHRGRHVVTLAGAKAAAFRARVAQAAGEDERQLLMARATGNFKRGNERVARARSRRP
jgi:hypothetical protein